MIVVKIEMYPQGSQIGSYEIGRAYISNDVAKTIATHGSLGDYTFKLWGGISGRTVDPKKPAWRKGKVIDFDRKVCGAWDLLYLALKQALEKKKPKEKE